ncbi:nitrous oxide reductase accessory protein NosL [Jhaorihella thermophila]
MPFSVRADAEGFAAKHGGRVVRLAEIPDAAVLAPVADQGADPDEDNYLDRLKAVSHKGNG